jgi:hypothetical protein
MDINQIFQIASQPTQNGWWNVFVHDPLAVMTAILVGVGVWTLCLTKRSDEKKLRAYLNVSPQKIQLNRYPDTESKMQVKIPLRIINSGQTPAYNIRHVMLIDIFPLSLLVDDYFGEELNKMPEASNIVGSRDYVEGYPEKYFTIDEFNQAVGNDASKRICIYGKICYDDIFEKTRTTNFCRLVRFDQESIEKLKSEVAVGELNVVYEFAKIHNDAN